MKTIQHDSVVPLYQQLCELLREEIENGVYQVGDQIPSEDKLSSQYNLSRVTVRNALNHLVEDNILVRIHGKGTFVSTSIQVESVFAGGSFTKSCLQMGVTPRTQLLGVEELPADKNVSRHLLLAEGETILRIRRVRLVDETPVIYELDYLPMALAALRWEDLEHSSLLELIHSLTGKRADSFEDVIDIKYADKECAASLGCKVSTPFLWVGQTVFSEDRIVYYNEQFIRSDRYKYSIKSVAP